MVNSGAGLLVTGYPSTEVMVTYTVWQIKEHQPVLSQLGSGRVAVPVFAVIEDALRQRELQDCQSAVTLTSTTRRAKQASLRPSPGSPWSQALLSIEAASWMASCEPLRLLPATAAARHQRLPTTPPWTPAVPTPASQTAFSRLHAHNIIINLLFEVNGTVCDISTTSWQDTW